MELKDLMSHFTRGTVSWISVRPGRAENVKVLPQVMAVEQQGLEGDRYRSIGGSRQVTLIQEEHLHAMGSILKRPPVDPSLLRRNIVVKGINLLALKGRRFRIGDALLEYSGECHPCSRMEENLGEGGYNAMRGHGGITARVISFGLIRVGDAVEAMEEKLQSELPTIMKAPQK
jgi:MOSC domain-containing protein YiiM